MKKHEHCLHEISHKCFQFVWDYETICCGCKYKKITYDILEKYK